MEGVSIIICTYNGASRLPTTLAHLKVQETSQTPWELMLVDNASTDATTESALSNWGNGPVPLRIVHEPRPGVRYARERGLAEAKYRFLGFVDDDNWVANNWVRTAYEIMSSDPRLGALGSIRTPACETSPPAWFESVHSAYAILTDNEFEQMQEPPAYLPTAGLCVRKEAWSNLIENGFSLHLNGRSGKKLLGGEDTELTMALRLGGWKLRIDSRLRLQHFMPARRLRWSYARSLARDHSASLALLDAYSSHNASLQPGFRRWLSDRWWYQFGSSVRKLVRHPRALVTALLSSGEGRKDVIEIEQALGRAFGLLQHTDQYSALRREVREMFRGKQPTSFGGEVWKGFPS